MHQLIQYINQYATLSDEAVHELEKLADIETFAKNQHILQQGEYCRKIWFIISGMVRKYHLYNGKDVTVWIHTENDIFTSLQSYSEQVPSGEYLQACETSEIISITRANSEKLSKFPEFVAFSNQLITKQMGCVDLFSREFSQKNAKEKYEYLLKVAPAMVKRAKLGYIASIMGVTQETLSRVRKEF